MDDSSPLAMQFKQLDADGDGKLTPDQVYNLLKMLGKNIYKGSVASATKKLNYNQQNPSHNSLFTFSQFREFFESLDNPLKHDIWKGKYQILQTINQIRKAVQLTQQNNTAAPGAKPEGNNAPFKGDIEITVGPTNQNYDSFIQVKLEKIPKAESKPFVKIIFQQSSNETAKQLETKFKKLQVGIFDLMKSSDPESAQILDYIHIITNVSENKLNIFVTTSNQLLVELGTLAAQFIDRVLGSTVEAKLQFKHEFNIDINKFIQKQSQYSFYQTLTKNYHTRLTWNAMNFRQSAKQILKATEVFKDFQYDKADPALIMLIGLLHTQICEANLVFENANVVATELESKGQILQFLVEAQRSIKQQAGDLGILQAIACLNNKVYIEASIGDWKAQVSTHIKDVNQLFSEKVLPKQQNSEGSSKQGAPQLNIKQLSIKKPLSLGGSSENLSATSKKKKKVQQTGTQQVKVLSKSPKKIEQSSSVEKKPRQSSLKKQTTPKVKIAKKQSRSSSVASDDS